MEFLTPPVLLIIVLVGVGLFVMGIYNKLIGMKNTVENALSDIDVQIKKRFDLVDNLVNTVK